MRLGRDASYTTPPGCSGALDAKISAPSPPQSAQATGPAGDAPSTTMLQESDGTACHESTESGTPSFPSRDRNDATNEGTRNHASHAPITPDVHATNVNLSPEYVAL